MRSIYDIYNRIYDGCVIKLIINSKLYQHNYHDCIFNNNSNIQGEERDKGSISYRECIVDRDKGLTVAKVEDKGGNVEASKNAKEYYN